MTDLKSNPQTAAALLIRAYARGRVVGHVSWSDVEFAFEQARREEPGLYETLLRDGGVDLDALEESRFHREQWQDFLKEQWQDLLKGRDYAALSEEEQQSLAQELERRWTERYRAIITEDRSTLEPPPSQSD